MPYCKRLKYVNYSAIVYNKERGSLIVTGIDIFVKSYPITSLRIEKIFTFFEGSTGTGNIFLDYEVGNKKLL